MIESIKKGLLVGTIESIWLLGGFSALKLLFSDAPQSILRTLTGLLGLVILFAGILYGIKKVRDHSHPENFSYLQSVKTGAIISVVVGVMVSVFSLAYVTLINPGFANDMVREAEKSLAGSRLPADVIHQKLESVRSEFSTARLVVAPLFVQPVMGVLFSLIISLFLKKKK